MDEIIPSSKVIIRDALGRELPKIALTGVMMGEDFPVIWACRESEWEAARSEERPPEGVPWPAEDVRPA